MIKVKISNRMQMVAQTVTNGYRVADIGCDHAYTSIYLIQEKIALKVIAMDINKGPLKKARENVYTYNCEDFIETRLSDGATLLREGEVDSIIIAGMGGKLAIKILSDSLKVVKKCKELILQPQSEIHLVRKFLIEKGFFITEEKMLQEDGKFYVIIKAICEYDECAVVSYNEVEYLFGKYLLETKNNILKKYLEHELKICEKICEELNKYCLNTNTINTNIANTNIELRKQEIMFKEKNIREGLAYYEM